MDLGHRLPGIRLDAAPPTPAGARFPRMDVALFVGIAERGPCHRPVQIDSVAAFEAVFGGTAKLAFDPASGDVLTANLAPSVTAFFSNGGAECWVIRAAWTTELAAGWEATSNAPPEDASAASGTFALNGLLARLPRATDGASRVGPSYLGASSLGAWSDNLTLSARAQHTTFGVESPVRHRWGLRFRTKADLRVGDLIELDEYDARITRYAKVMRLDQGEVLAAWCSSFLEIRTETPVMDGYSRLPGRRNRVPARFFEGLESRIEFEADYPELVAGSWIMFYEQGEAIWLRADRVEGRTAFGPAWQQVGSRVPETPFIARKVTLDVRSDLDGRSEVTSGIGLTPEAANSLFALLEDEHFYAGEERLGRARPLFATPEATRANLADTRANFAGGISDADLVQAFADRSATAAQRPFLRAAFLPLGLSGIFAPATVPMQNDQRRALERSGLVPCDHRLFIDPAFAALPMQEIERSAIQRHDLDEARLFGMHAAYDIPGEAVGDASILTVTDATQPGWELRSASDTLPRPDAGSFTPPTWRDHSGPCLAEDGPELETPDFGSFIDSTVEVLRRPNFGAPIQPVTGDSFRLSWSSSDAGVTFVLEESARHDFADAAEIWRGTDGELILDNRAEGAYYYRLRTELNGNTSPYAARLVVLRSTDYIALPTDEAELRRIHIAMLRLSAGSAAMTAILSLPRSYRADAAQDYATTLVIAGFGDTALTLREERALSYGTLFHPWLSGGREDDLLSVPPDGAVAGHMAELAQEQGAWIAPAGRDYADIVGLYPAINFEDRPASDAARINMVLPRPRGFSAHAARSLSGEREWNQVNVRRLFIMLRRMVLTLGRRFVFENNGPMARRAIERSILSHLDILQRRGAFSGKLARESYFVRLRESAQDQDNGRILAEIGIAPSHPLEFIEIALVQHGARLTLAEAA